MQLDRKRMCWISGIVELVDLQRHTISLWLGDGAFNIPQTIALTEAIPQWMRFPHVDFSTSIPLYCLDSESLEKVLWGPFLCDGMEYWTEEEAFWQMGQIAQRVADRVCAEVVSDHSAKVCARDLWCLIQNLLKVHQSDGWPMLPSAVNSRLECCVQEMRATLVQTFRILDRDYPSLHVLCDSALKPHAQKNEDDFSECSEQQRLHAFLSQLLNCEADSVILARLLMQVYPDQACVLQTMIEQYHRQALSPLEDVQ